MVYSLRIRSPPHNLSQFGLRSCSTYYVYFVTSDLQIFLLKTRLYLDPKKGNEMQIHDKISQNFPNFDFERHKEVIKYTFVLDQIFVHNSGEMFLNLNCIVRDPCVRLNVFWLFLDSKI